MSKPRLVVPEATDDPFFDGIGRRNTGTGCAACRSSTLSGFIDDLIRGMAGDGPFAQYLSPSTQLSELHRRVTDELLMRARSLPVYPRKLSAFVTHCKSHRRELWNHVEAARKQA